MNKLIFFRSIFFIFLLFLFISCNDNQNKIQSDKQEKRKNDTNINNIKMRKILNGDFTFKMIFVPFDEMPFELTIQSHGDEHLLSINNVYSWYRCSKDYYGDNYIDFNNCSFLIQESHFRKFIDEIQKIDYSTFDDKIIVLSDGLSTLGVFYNNKKDTVGTRFICFNCNLNKTKFFNSLLELTFSTIKSEPFIDLLLNVVRYFDFHNNVYLIHNDPNYIIAYKDLRIKQAQELNKIINSINNEPVILDLSNTLYIDTLFLSNLSKLISTRNKLYLLIKEKNKIFYSINNKQKKYLNVDYLKYLKIEPKIVFNCYDSICAKIWNENNIYSRFALRLNTGKPVPVTDSIIERDMKDWNIK